MKLLFEIAKEFKCLLTFCTITVFALIFWNIGAKDMATGFGGGALAVITASSRSQANNPPE